MTYKSSSITSSKGLKLYVHHWPAVIPKATMIIVHGYAEHGYRYDEFAKFLNEHQIEVYAYDQMGYGQSEGLKAYVDRFGDYINDLDKVIRHVKGSQMQSTMPIFLFGHSMGGLVVAKYAIEEENSHIAGVITSAAALKLDEDLSPILQALAPILGAIFPKLKTEKLDKTYLTRSEENYKAYMNDPLNYLDGTRARTGAEMIKTIKHLSHKFSEMKIPLLALHGTGEKLTDYRGTKALYDEAISTDKTLKLYEGLYHELIHEPEKEMVMNDIIQWIEERVI